MEQSPPPRRLVRLWWIIRDGLPPLGRYRRYVLAIAPALLLIWGVTGAFLAFAPTRYASETALILPGSGVGGSLNLNEVGQATTVTSSAFSSTTLSPTENYKRLLMAQSTLARAAAMLGEEPGDFPEPSITLVDQTNLIEITMTGDSPEHAQARGEALRSAFLTTLEELREDEATARESADAERLVELEAKVAETQAALLEFQGRTGLASLEQFNARLGTIDDLRAREREARAGGARDAAVRSRLSSVLDISPANVRRALRLKADPVFQSLLDRYAEVNTDATEAAGTLGEAHATREELEAERSSLRREIVARGGEVSGLSERALLGFADISVTDGRERMFEALIAAEGMNAGSQAMLAEIRRQIGQQGSNSAALAEQAGELADLLREHRVAEAVFSSALARLDTNKADPFASYPLVQTFEAPSLPDRPSSPSLLIALAGAIAASLIVIVGFALAWLRQPILAKLLPKG